MLEIGGGRSHLNDGKYSHVGMLLSDVNTDQDDMESNRSSMSSVAESSRLSLLISPMLRAVVWFIISIYPLSLSADSQEIIEYQYDNAGNLIGIQRNVNSGPPDVASLTPPYIHKDSTITVDAVGVNLFGAEVSMNTPGITLLNVNPVSAELMKLTISANNSTTIGTADITFSTRLGSDVEPLIIAERVPIISTNPNPITLISDGSTRTVTLAFDLPYSTDQEYDLRVVNPLIAESSVQQVTMPAGQKETSFTMTGLTEGSTSLEITQLANFLALTIPVYVTDSYDLPVGLTEFRSRPMGVSVSRFDVPLGTSTFSGIPLGVTVSRVAVPPGISDIMSSPLGVNVSRLDIPSGSLSRISDPVGATLPPYVSGKTPNSVNRGTNETIILTGVGLGDVTSVSFNLTSGISQTSPFTVNSAGTQLQIFIHISSTAETGLRQIELNSATGNVPFTVQGIDTLQIF